MNITFANGNEEEKLLKKRLLIEHFYKVYKVYKKNVIHNKTKIH